MGVVARTPVSQLSPERLRAYEENDPAAARARACDPRLFVRNQRPPGFEEGFRLEKRLSKGYDTDIRISAGDKLQNKKTCGRELLTAGMGEEGILEIRCPANTAFRLDRILSSGFGISHEQIEKRIRDGYITGVGTAVFPPPRSRNPAFEDPAGFIKTPRNFKQSPHGSPWGLSGI